MNFNQTNSIYAIDIDNGITFVLIKKKFKKYEIT